MLTATSFTADQQMVFIMLTVPEAAHTEYAKYIRYEKMHDEILYVVTIHLDSMKIALGKTCFESNHVDFDLIFELGHVDFMPFTPSTFQFVGFSHNFCESVPSLKY